MNKKKQRMYIIGLVVLLCGIAFAGEALWHKQVNPKSLYRVIEQESPPGVTYLYPDNITRAHMSKAQPVEIQPVQLHPVKFTPQHPSYEQIQLRYNEWKQSLIEAGYLNPDGSQKYVPGEVMVQFKNEARSMVQPTTNAQGTPVFGITSVDNINTKHNAKNIERTLSDENIKSGDEQLALKHGLDLIYKITFKTDADVQAIAAEYANDPNVREATANWRHYPLGPARRVPNDPYYDSTQWVWDDDKYPEAWQVQTGSTGDTLCEISLGWSITGAHPDYANPDLDLNYLGSGGGDPGLAEDHASACAGCMAAENNNSYGQPGVAGGWGTNGGCKWTYFGLINDGAHTVAAFKWGGDHTVAAQNASFGGGQATAGEESAINYSYDRNCFTVASAGNDFFPAIDFPAAYGNVIAVTGTQRGLSNHGDEVVFTFAPFVDLAATGSVFAIRYNSQVWGTSFSSPKVVGTIGLIKGAHPSWTKTQIRNYLIQSGDWIDFIPANATYIPPGMVGGGRVNPYEAINIYDKNVSVNRIFVPLVRPGESDSIGPGKQITPQVVVQNRGINRQSFNVIMKIDTITGANKFTDTVWVEGLADRTDNINKGKLISFDSWTTPTNAATYLVKAWSTLSGDQNAVNDTVVDTLFVRAPPAGGGIIDTLAYHGDPAYFFSDSNCYWAVRMTPESPCSIMAMIFYAYDPNASPDSLYKLYIWSNDANDLPNGIVHGPQNYKFSGNGIKYVSFSDIHYSTTDFHIGFWVRGGPSTASYGPHCIGDDGTTQSYHSSIQVPGGVWQGTVYDWYIEAVVKYPPALNNDMAMWEIISPLTHELSGVPLIPTVVIKNLGNFSKTNIPVWYKVDSLGVNKYSQTKTVTKTLATFDTALVTFPAWVPNWSAGGTYNTRGYVNMGTEDARNNDTLYRDVLVNWNDTIVYDNGAGRWFFSSPREYWDVTFHPTLPCSVIGVDYYVYVSDLPATHAACTLIAYEAENDTPTTRLWSQVRTNPPYGWNTYDFTTGQKIVRASAEDFGLGFWMNGIYGGDTVSLVADNGPLGIHSWNKDPDAGAPDNAWFQMAYNLFIRARVKYTAGAYNHDVALNMIDYPEPYGFVYPNKPVTPLATIDNLGRNSETFDVTLKITDSLGATEYTNTQNVTVPVAESKQVSFADWAPAVTDMDYTMTAYTQLGTDQKKSNDTLTFPVYCRTINIISYNEEYWGSAISGVDEYHAVRFTPERPCTVWGAYINLYTKPIKNTNPCTLFLWKDTLERPASKSFIDTVSFTLASLGATSSDPGDTNSIWRIRIDFDTKSYKVDKDFWIGLFVNMTTSGNDSLHLVSSDAFDYENIAGRTYSVDDRMMDNPPDSATWYGPWYRMIEGVDTFYSQADWEIKALVKYLEYPGDIPMPPDIRVTKSGNNAVITWHKVVTDVSGNPTTCDHYITHTSATYDWVPSSYDVLYAGPETTYTHTNALISSRHNYLTYDYNLYETKSAKSNMGYVFAKFVNENAATTDRNWISLPWYSNYATVSALTNDLSPAGDPLIKIVNLRDDNLYESWIWDPDFGEWYGTDFSIVPGRGYEVVTISDDTLILVGSNKDDGLVTLNENPAATDRNWVSIPYNNVYTVVSDITTEYAPAGDPLIKLVNLRDDNLYESWIWDPDFGEWYGTDFAIETGRGYEFVTIIDTTWNPTEFSNEAAREILALKQSHKSQAEVYLGKSFEPDRVPLWVAEAQEGKNLNLANAQCYKPAVGNAKHVEAQASIPHIVRMHVDAKGIDNLLFTAYRPDKPYDVLTEKMTGSGIARNGDVAAIWFDAGNFRTPWQAGEEVILIVEAAREGKGYVAVQSFMIDRTVDVQEIEARAFVAIPEPSMSKSRVSWLGVENENVIGYSLYQNDRRVNDRVIDRETYTVEGEVVLKLVVKGGYETVSGSQGAPTSFTPISYAFAINPNPFATQTTISYALPERADARIKVYDVTGRQVKTLVSQTLEPGYYSVNWAGTDDVGRKVATGVYFIQMNTEQFRSQHKVIFVR